MRWLQRRLGCGNARKSLWLWRSCCCCCCSCLVEKQGIRTSICKRLNPRSLTLRICRLLLLRRRFGCSCFETLSNSGKKDWLLLLANEVNRRPKLETLFVFVLPLSLVTRSVPSTTRIRESEDVTSTSDELPGTNYGMKWDTSKQLLVPSHEQSPSDFAPEEVSDSLITWKPVIFFWWAFFFLFCKFIWLFCCSLLSGEK